jgi:hypothetical protein
VPLDATEPQSPEHHPQSPAITENLQEIQSPSSPEIAVEDGAYPTSATAGNLQEKQPPLSPDIAVEDGAYPTSATAGNSQEKRPLLSPDVAIEEGAYPTSATAGKTLGNLVHLPPDIAVEDGVNPISEATGNPQEDPALSTQRTSESTREAHPPAASIFMIEAEVPETSAIILNLQEADPNPAPVIATLPTEDPNLAPSLAASTKAALIAVSVTEAEADRPMTSAPAKKTLKKSLPRTASQSAVAEARQRKGASSASIFQRKVQDPYRFRHKRKPTTAQLKGEKVKTSFKKLMGSTDESDGDFEELSPLIQGNDTEGQEEDSVFGGCEPIDTTIQEDRAIVINSTTQVEPTIFIYSTVLIDSTTSGSNNRLTVTSDAAPETAEAVSMEGKVGHVDLNSPEIVMFSKSETKKPQPPSLEISDIERVETASVRRTERLSSTSGDPPCRLSGPNASTPK